MSFLKSEYVDCCEYRREYCTITFLSFFSLSKRKDITKLSDQRFALKDAEVPFPLYTCVHVKKDVSAQTFCGKFIKVNFAQCFKAVYSSKLSQTAKQSVFVANFLF